MKLPKSERQGIILMASSLLHLHMEVSEDGVSFKAYACIIASEELFASLVRKKIRIEKYFAAKRFALKTIFQY
jgi:hypothetical protein